MVTVLDSQSQRDKQPERIVGSFHHSGLTVIGWILVRNTKTERLSWSVYKPQHYKLAPLSEIAPLQFYHQPQSSDNTSSSCLMLFTSLCSIIILAMIDNNRECINVSPRHPKVIVLKRLTESSFTDSNVHVGSLKSHHMLQIRLLWGPSRINRTVLLSPKDDR